MNAAKLLVIDDEADEERAKLVAWRGRADFEVRFPAELTISDLEASNVVVVDYRLDEPWTERDEQCSISLQPMNGLALSAVLRSHERDLSGCPTAFLLRSAHLSDLSPEFPPDSRLHVIARQNNLEWVFSKAGSVEGQMSQIICLAEAIEALPSKWPSADAAGAEELLMQWLGLSAEAPWADLAWQDIEECHPPLHELSDHKHGMRLVRWMLHRILPYPCFLWTLPRLAARLRVETESLRDGFRDGLSDVFETATYSGALAEFDGQPRWWGRGVESVLWNVTGGRSFDSKQTIEELNAKCKDKLVLLSLSQPVLCINKEYQFRDELCEISRAVRVQPDDWPAFAEQAWAAIEDARDEIRLSSIVVTADREQLLAEDDVEGM